MTKDMSNDATKPTKVILRNVTEFKHVGDLLNKHIEHFSSLKPGFVGSTSYVYENVSTGKSLFAFHVYTTEAGTVCIRETRYDK